MNLDASDFSVTRIPNWRESRACGRESTNRGKVGSARFSARAARRAYTAPCPNVTIEPTPATPPRHRRRDAPDTDHDHTSTWSRVSRADASTRVNEHDLNLDTLLVRLRMHRRPPASLRRSARAYRPMPVQRRMTQPPSTLIVWPLIQSPALEQRRSNVPTRSSGGPDFLPGIPASSAARIGESAGRLA